MLCQKKEKFLWKFYGESQGIRKISHIRSCVITLTGSMMSLSLPNTWECIKVPSHFIFFYFPEPQCLKGLYPYPGGSLIEIAVSFLFVSPGEDTLELNQGSFVRGMTLWIRSIYGVFSDALKSFRNLQKTWHRLLLIIKLFWILLRG